MIIAVDDVCLRLAYLWMLADNVSYDCVLVWIPWLATSALNSNDEVKV